MKLRLPTRLVQALLTTCASVLSTTLVYADIPAGYTPVTITDVGQLADYTESDYIAFIISSDIANNAYRMSGEHQYWTDSILHTHTMSFSGIESELDGAVLYIKAKLDVEHLQELSFTQIGLYGDTGYGLAIYGGYGATITLSANGSVTFDGNYGAIYGDDSSTITLSGNGSVMFISSYDKAAIYGGSGSDITLSSNESVEFSGNNGSISSCSGAIYGESDNNITLNNNGSVSFSYNTGAIYGDNSNTITLSGNGSVTFSENFWDDVEGGGSVISAGTINLTENGSVTFNDNWSGANVVISASTINLTENGSVTFNDNRSYGGDGGGAIRASTLNITGNDSVTFSGNESYYPPGGAIFSYDTVNITENETVTFSENSAGYAGGAIFCCETVNITENETVTFSENKTDGNGGAISVAYEYGTINITDNGTVTFSENSADLDFGGAIYAYGGAINITGNGHVVFQGNYERPSYDSDDTTRLRSVSMEGGSLNLAAGEGQDITFYDTLYAHSYGVYWPLTVSYNARYRDGDGVMREATGDIVFSGVRAAEDLAALKPDYTAQELTDSLTTEVYATTNLYGGRLRIEDGAIYKGNGINVAEDSAATLRLAGGSLVHAGYDVLLNTGTTLELLGVNSITAGTLDMRNGSTMTFNLGADDGALLNLNAVLQTGELTVSLVGDLTSEHSLISLYDAAQYDTSLWTSGSVTVVGTSFDQLLWENGVLVYTPETLQHIVLDEDSEMEDFGDDKRVDIEGNSHSLTVKHPVDLVHLAMESGAVRLEGADNNVVFITLTEDGTLELAAGSGLNVGNIVSMVANGSADLVLSGDIEISDLKAYGKPGNKGTLSYANMTTAGDYTIENMTISGSLIDVGEGTTLYLVNVDIKSDTHITDDPARVFAQNANIQLDKTNTWVDQEITAAQDTLLYMCGDTQRSITLAVGSEIVELTSSMFDTVTLTGTDLWLDMTGIAEATYGKDYFTLDFQDFAREMAKAQVDVENLRVYATLDGERYTEAYSTANGGLTTTLYFQVPEPATSTLILLALAALAARRRRK